MTVQLYCALRPRVFIAGLCWGLPSISTYRCILSSKTSHCYANEGNLTQYIIKWATLYQTNAYKTHFFQPSDTETQVKDLTAKWSRSGSSKTTKIITIQSLSPWSAVDLRCSVEIKTPFVLYVEHQVSPIQELHNEEQMILFANNQRMETLLMLSQPHLE